MECFLLIDGWIQYFCPRKFARGQIFLMIKIIEPLFAAFRPPIYVRWWLVGEELDRVSPRGQPNQIKSNQIKYQIKFVAL